MASEEKFREFFVEKKKDWEAAKRYHMTDRNRTVPDYLINVVGVGKLAWDFQNDKRFMRHDVCRFVQSDVNDIAVSLLMDILGDGLDVPLLGAATTLVLDAVRFACESRVPRPS